MWAWKVSLCCLHIRKSSPRARFPASPTTPPPCPPLRPCLYVANPFPLSRVSGAASIRPIQASPLLPALGLGKGVYPSPRAQTFCQVPPVCSYWIRYDFPESASQGHVVPGELSPLSTPPHPTHRQHDLRVAVDFRLGQCPLGISPWGPPLDPCPDPRPHAKSSLAKDSGRRGAWGNGICHRGYTVLFLVDARLGLSAGGDAFLVAGQSEVYAVCVTRKAADPLEQFSKNLVCSTARRVQAPSDSSFDNYFDEIGGKIWTRSSSKQQLLFRRVSHPPIFYRLGWRRLATTL